MCAGASGAADPVMRVRAAAWQANPESIDCFPFLIQRPKKRLIVFVMVVVLAPLLLGSVNRCAAAPATLPYEISGTWETSWSKNEAGEGLALDPDHPDHFEHHTMSESGGMTYEIDCFGQGTILAISDQYGVDWTDLYAGADPHFTRLADSDPSHWLLRVHLEGSFEVGPLWPHTELQSYQHCHSYCTPRDACAFIYLSFDPTPGTTTVVRNSGGWIATTTTTVSLDGDNVTVDRTISQTLNPDYHYWTSTCAWSYDSLSTANSVYHVTLRRVGNYEALTVNRPYDPATGTDLIVAWDTKTCLTTGDIMQAVISTSPDIGGDPSPILGEEYVQPSSSPRSYVHRFRNVTPYINYYAAVRIKKAGTSTWSDYIKTADNEPIKATYPVFLVHGLRGSPMEMGAIEVELMNAGVKYPLIVDNLAPAGLPGETHYDMNAMALSQFIENHLVAIEALTQSKYGLTIRPANIDIVAHSMGGLISRRYIQGGEPWAMAFQARQVQRLFTLGTPNLGSKVGEIMRKLCAVSPGSCNPAPGELSERSMQGFNWEYYNWPTVTLYAAAGYVIGPQDLDNDLRYSTQLEDWPNDGIVPVKSALWPYAVEQPSPMTLLVNADHFALKTSPTVLSWLSSHIVSPYAAPPLAANEPKALTLPLRDGQPSGPQISSADYFFVESADAHTDTLTCEGGDLDIELYSNTPNLRFAVRSPGGQQWDQSSIANDPNVRTATDETGWSVVFPGAAPGMWIVTVRSNEAGDPAGVCLAAAASSAVRADYFVSETMPAAHDSITVRVTLNDGTGAILGATADCHVRQLPGGAVQTLALVDDGLHGDAAGADGVYGAAFLPPLDAALLDLTINVVGQSNAGVTFTRTLDESVMYENGADVVDIPGLINCVPSMQTITEANSSGNGVYRNGMTVRCESAGSGPIYGYSIDVTWDPAVVTAAPSDFVRPSTGAFATAGIFVTSAILSGVRIDAAIGGARGGIANGELFKCTFTAAANVDASSPISVRINSIRDRQNTRLSGFTAADGTIVVDLGGPSGVPGSAAEGPSHLVNVIPNPANPKTDIVLNLSAQSGPALVQIHDLRGRLIRQLAVGDGSAGQYTVEWNGKDNAGRDAASGKYLVRLVAADARVSRGVTLIR